MDPLPAALRWRTTAIPFLLAVLLLSSVSPSRAIYCDEDDCYDLLGSANIPFLPSIVFNLSFISRCNAPSSHSQGFSECQCFRNQESLLQTLLEAVRVSPPWHSLSYSFFNIITTFSLVSCLIQSSR